MIKSLLIALGCLLWLTVSAFATCAPTIAPGSMTIVDCNQGSLVTNSPVFSITDVNALPLGHWFAWSNAATKLVSGIPVSGQISFTNASASIAWTGHGLTAGSYLTLSATAPNQSGTLTLPSNFTASTLSTQTVYYVIAAGLTTNAFELSATPGGSAVVANASGGAYAFNLVAGFSAWANSVFNNVVLQQQAGATAAPVPPAQIPITPGQ